MGFTTIWQAFVLANGAIWLAVGRAGFSRIAHGQYAIFIALSGKQSQKTLKFNKILFIKVESVKMSDEEHCESEFYYPEVENEGYETVFC